MSVTLTVTGMNCAACEADVVEALERVAEVESASADHETNTATVEGETDVNLLVAAVADAGYEASA
jgi:copper chaperone CopZ